MRFRETWKVKEQSSLLRERKKTISVEADIIDLDDMMHAAICCSVLRQNGGRSSVIENQVVRKLKGFL